MARTVSAPPRPAPPVVTEIRRGPGRPLGTTQDSPRTIVEDALATSHDLIHGGDLPEAKGLDLLDRMTPVGDPRKPIIQALIKLDQAENRRHVKQDLRLRRLIKFGEGVGVIQPWHPKELS